MRIIATLAALAALSACTAAPTEEQRAIARYLCADDEGALADYLAARGGTVSNLPAVGPERALYCAMRGDRLAGMP